MTGEVATIMRSLFNEEEIMKMFIRSERYEAAQESARKTAIETAERMIRDGEMPLEKISRYVPSLSFDELRELEAEITQLA